MKENWLERQRREMDADPREQEMRRMFQEIKEITAPVKIIPVSEVPEFADNAVRSGAVSKIVRQGQMASTEHLPIRTDNASNCNIFIIKTPEENGENTYTLVHVWAGDLDLNLPDHRRKDIAELANEKSTAIGITGGRSVPIQPTAREFKYEGITTTKHIDIPSGNRYVSVVFRPKSNDILIRIGSDMDATEVWEYEGF